MSPERTVDKLIVVADGISAARALVKGANIVATQSEGVEADAVHEILQAVEDRLNGIITAINAAIRFERGEKAA